MAIEVKKVTKDEVVSLAGIGFNAFPGGSTYDGILEWIEETVEQDSADDVFYGAFQDDKIVGGTRYINYQMNLLSQKINVGGLGFVCVDLLHKKEKIAKELMEAFLKHYRAQQVNMVLLYPFNIHFYKKMGFGYGTTMHKFEVKPEGFPKWDSKAHLSFATEEDNQLILDCFNRIAAKTNGMIYRDKFNLSKDIQVIVYKEDDLVKGYMTFKFEEGKDGYIYFLNLRLYGLLYEDVKVLREFSTFLNTQSDQVQRIMYVTQDDTLKHFLIDPTNGRYDAFQSLYLESYVTAPGAMYRVVDVVGVFKELAEHNFGGQDCRLKLTVRDTLLADNDGSTIIVFEKGLIKSIDSVGEYDVEIVLDIAEFSSLLIGAVNFKGLLRYGLVTISEESYVDILEMLFHTDKPNCFTYF